jgi:CheY-like chemotaxis protein
MQVMQQRIMVVDDERLLMEVVALFLKGHGYTSSLCDNAQQALALLQGENIPLVLSDVEMPDTDGCKLLLRIRREYRTSAVTV